ncbi:unnamed protein product [Paramecium sonneborni]|uniref:Uncharacterized protein n=1 Tax=Paramecium sonneborni TaxID=65129 RepID=A0A8S1QUW6_9CILI|nr:unnamed protein product [Paramecium sonneborni]
MQNRPYSAIMKLKSETSEVRSRDSMSHLMFTPKSKKVISPPAKCYADGENLYIQNIHQKQEVNVLRMQNIKLRTLIQQLQNRVYQLEKVDRLQLQTDPLGLTTSKQEGSIVPILKAKIREQAQQISELTEDLKRQCKSVKLTQLVELQKEIKNQQDEIMRLKQFQLVAIKVTDQDLFSNPDIGERIKNYVLTINAQEKQIEVLEKQINQLKYEYQELIEDNMKVQEEIKYITFEKTQLKRKLEDQIITETEQYQLKKREYLEKKLQSVLKQVDTLKGELSLYENKYKSLTKQYQDQDREFKQQLVLYQKTKMNLEDAIIKKDQLIQDLQDRVAIQDLLKQKNPSEEHLVKHLIPPKCYRSSFTQFPDIEQPQPKATDIINTHPIDKERLQVLLEDLRYKVISLCLTKSRLQYLLKGIEFIQLKQGLDFFMKRPFNYQEEDALLLSRYYIGEDQGYGYKIQWEDTQSVNDMISKITPSKEDTLFNYKTIINKKTLIKFLNGEMKLLKLQDTIYNIDDYIIYIQNNTKWNQEQLSFLRLINSLYFGDQLKIDQGFLRLYLREECELMDQQNKLQKIDFQIYRSIPKAIIQQNDDEEMIEQKSEMKIQIKVEPVLTLSQLRLNDYSLLKTSESRKPTTCGRENVIYSENYVESIPLVKKQSEQIKFVDLKVEEIKEQKIEIKENQKEIKEQQKEEKQNEIKMFDSFLQPPSLLKNKAQSEEEEQIVQEEIYCEEL